MGTTLDTVTDSIGEEYKEWERGDIVYISAQTGKGKTYFILHTLLPYYTELEKQEVLNEPNRQKREAAENYKDCLRNKDITGIYDKRFLPVEPRKGRRILYLVNRLALKKQIENEIKYFSAEQKAMICIMTYQQIEESLKNGRNIGFNIAEFGCVVCDECHYFLSDSNFNTYTELSYRFVRDDMYDTVRVFISATIENIRDYMEKDRVAEDARRSALFGSSYAMTIYEKLAKKSNRVYKYKSHFDSKQYRIHAILDEREIEDIVKESEEGKWLIFVNNIQYGEELKETLEKSLKDKMKNLPEKERKNVTVGFLSSDYRCNQQMATEFNSISARSKSTVYILIATSVIDNGVSIKDEELKNVIVLADTRTEFLQMTGRKRLVEEEKMDLYIALRNRNYFKKRLDAIGDAYDIASKYKGQLETEIAWKINAVEYQNSSYHLLAEWHFLVCEDARLMQMMFDPKDYQKKAYDDVKKSFFLLGSYLILSQLAEKNLYILVQYYQEIIREFDESGDQYVFLRRQLEWLGKSEEEIEAFVKSMNQTVYDRICSVICSFLGEGSRAELSTEKKGTSNESEALRLKQQVKDDVCVMLKDISNECGDENVRKQCGSFIREMGKNDRHISSKLMEFLRQYGKLPFKVTVNAGKYIIEKCDVE